jgi:CubicO group peptidase (beta-lactamase class C family)
MPLGMRHTTFREPHPDKKGIPGPMPAALAGDVSDAFRWTPTGFQRRSFEYMSQVAPAGSVSSTASDMARYMLMQLANGQLNGVSIYGPKTAQAFRTPIRSTPKGINGWAHGFLALELPGGWRAYGHDGGTLSFNSMMLVSPDLNLGIFISANTETAAGLAHRLPAALVQQFYAAPQVFPRPGSPELSQAASVFSGYYVGTRRAYSGLEGFVMRLRNGVTVEVSGDGKLVLSGGGQNSTFVPEGEVSEGRFISTTDNSRLAFTVRDGKARAFVGSGGAVLFQRAGFWKDPSTLSLLALLALAAAIATLLGIALRNRREFRENTVQARAGLVQNIQAGLWLISFVMFGVWAAGVGDIARVMYRWPGALLILASASALVAAALTITTIIALPYVWRGGRRVDSWTHLRKAFFTVTVIIYALFSWTLWTWGALSPWSG